MTYIVDIIEQRWQEACAKPDIRRWKSLATMADDLATAIEQNAPDSSMGPALRGLAVECQTRMLAMMPKSVGGNVDDVA